MQAWQDYHLETNQEYGRYEKKIIKPQPSQNLLPQCEEQRMCMYEYTLIKCLTKREFTKRVRKMQFQLCFCVGGIDKQCIQCNKQPRRYISRTLFVNSPVVYYVKTLIMEHTFLFIIFARPSAPLSLIQGTYSITNNILLLRIQGEAGKKNSWPLSPRGGGVRS